MRAGVGERQGARLGITFLGAGAVALLVMQVVQQTAGAFEPRPEVRAVLAATVAFAGLALERLRFLSSRAAGERDRQASLSEGLRDWPARTVAEVDPLTLGVFPPKAGIELDKRGLPPYVARDVDVELDQALAAGGLLLVVGPARSGKTRAAYEAARRSAPDRRVLVPEDGGALSQLVEDRSLRLSARDILWLDDLERFLPHLGPAELRLLVAGGGSVVATLRTPAYRELLEAGGERGERGRRLLARARTIQLREGPGQELSASWEDEHLPLEAPAPTSPPERPSLRWMLEPVLGLALLLTVGGGVTLAALVATGGFTTPSVGQQLDDIRERAADRGDRVVTPRDAELHGTRSHVLVLRSESERPDELRIYDEQRSGRLRRRLAFRPAGRRLTFARLDLTTIGDVDDDGLGEVVAAYDVPSPGENLLLRVPVVAAWDHGRYVLSPLLSEPAKVPRRHRGGRLIGARPYLSPYTVGSRKGYAVTSFALIRGNRGRATVLTGVAQYEPTVPGRAVLALNSYSLDLTRGRPRLTRSCNPLRPKDAYVTTVPVRADQDYARDLRRLGPVATGLLTGVEIKGDCLQGE